MEKTLGLDDVLLQVVEDAVTRRHEPQNLLLTGMITARTDAHQSFTCLLGDTNASRT
jgi:hypothetical protein